jgi:lipid II:glycine glycyltransferase (peptidoglycan interpeptide bridge formation enzyme)
LKITEVRKQNPLYGALQKFAEANRLFFHAAAWLDNYDDRLVQCAILNNNNQVIGCFMYFVFKKAGMRFVISPPYTPGIDLYYVNPAESVVGRNSFNKELMSELADYFVALKAHFTDIQLSTVTKDVQPFIWKGYSSSLRYTYHIDLKSDESTIWNNLSSEKRKSVTKAGKDGIETNLCNDAGVIYKLVKASLERNGLLKNENLLKSIIDKFTGSHSVITFVASHEAAPVSATFCVINGKSAVYLFGGFDEANRHHGAGVSCMWHSVLEAKRRGLHLFDFEGSMNEGIERYFREFGGELQSYPAIKNVKPWLAVVSRLAGRK